MGLKTKNTTLNLDCSGVLMTRTEAKRLTKNKPASFRMGGFMFISCDAVQDAKPARPLCCLKIHQKRQGGCFHAALWSLFSSHCPRLTRADATLSKITHLLFIFLCSAVNPSFLHLLLCLFFCPSVTFSLEKFPSLHFL